MLVQTILFSKIVFFYQKTPAKNRSRNVIVTLLRYLTHLSQIYEVGTERFPKCGKNMIVDTVLFTGFLDDLADLRIVYMRDVAEQVMFYLIV